MKPYTRMTNAKRLKLEALYNAGIAPTAIAREIETSHVTIYKELQRGTYMKLNSDYTETKRYSADRAQQRADFEAKSKGAPLKIGNDRKFVKFIETMILKHKYSPSAILDYIKEHNLAFRTKVCRATLYNYIDKGIFYHVTAKNLLRKGKMKKKKKPERARTLPRGTSIEERPKSVLDRAEFGHWEFDSVIGKKEKGSTLLCFTERKTRMEIIFRSKDKTATATVAVLNRLERKIGALQFRKIFKSITCDNGTEFSDTEAMERSYGSRRKRTQIYYCHPYCSSERGSNENQNGFIRRFIPKGTPISRYTDEDLKVIQDYINTYPRRLFDGKNSKTLFENELRTLGIKKFSNFF